MDRKVGLPGMNDVEKMVFDSLVGLPVRFFSEYCSGDSSIKYSDGKGGVFYDERN